MPHFDPGYIGDGIQRAGRQHANFDSHITGAWSLLILAEAEHAQNERPYCEFLDHGSLDFEQEESHIYGDGATGRQTFIAAAMNPLPIGFRYNVEADFAASES